MSATTHKKSLLKSYLLTPLYGIVVFLLVAMIYFQIFSPEKVADVFGFQIYYISYTKSMEPMLNYNDLIVVQKYDFDSLKKGDVITFSARTTDGSYMTITHKINDIWIDPVTNTKYLQTKGINKPYPDTIPVTRDGFNNSNKYIGKYVFKSEFLGNFFCFLKSGAGFVAIGINFICLTLVYLILINMEPCRETRQVLYEIHELDEIIEEYKRLHRNKRR